MWNSLPAEFSQPDVEIGQLRRLLTTFLFERDWRIATFLIIGALQVYLLTYLLLGILYRPYDILTEYVNDIIVLEEN